MKKFTHKQAVTILKRYASMIKRFHESTDAPEGQVRIGFYIEGNIGSADDFWNAMRALRRSKVEAERQHRRERALLRR